MADGAKHTSLASLAPDLLCLTYNGLSKAYRVAGYRAGWLAITGPKEHAAGFLEGTTDKRRPSAQLAQVLDALSPLATSTKVTPAPTARSS